MVVSGNGPQLASEEFKAFMRDVRGQTCLERPSSSKHKWPGGAVRANVEVCSAQVTARQAGDQSTSEEPVPVESGPPTPAPPSEALPVKTTLPT
ncbi:hypothetical protein MTO96_018776 [Rhipicephalus appendiculatus]